MLRVGNVLLENDLDMAIDKTILEFADFFKGSVLKHFFLIDLHSGNSDLKRENFFCLPHCCWYGGRYFPKT